MAQVPIELQWQPGETPRQWQQRQLANRQKPEPKPTQLSASGPTPTEHSAPKPIDPKTAPVGSREWAGCLLKEFGQELGAKYIDRGLTYSQALQERSAELTAEHKQLTEAVAKQERKAGRGKGFAGKLRFGGGFKPFGKHEQRKA